MLTGLSLTVVVNGIYLYNDCHFNAVTYDQIISSYFHKDPKTRNDLYDVDVWALWKELGIKPSSLRTSGSFSLRNLLNALRRKSWDLFPRNHYIFYVEPDKMVQLDCDFACLGNTKIISITKDSHCTQVLVFKRERKADTSDYIFSYYFTTGLDGMADRSNVIFLEPEPNQTFLEISYRNDYGTGTCCFGWSLYRIDKKSAKCLLKINTEGWSIDTGPTGYGYCCDITKLKETWPKIILTFFAEYVPWQDTSKQIGNKQVNRYKLKANVKLTWDYERRIFQYSPDNILSFTVMDEVLTDSVGFIQKKMYDLDYLSRPNCPITKRVIPQVECLAGWGL